MTLDRHPDTSGADDTSAVDETGEPAPLTDTRSPGQRRADALVEMSRLAGEYLALVIGADGLPAQDGIGGLLNQRPARSVPHVSIIITDHDTEETEESSDKTASETDDETPDKAASADGNTTVDENASDASLGEDVTTTADGFATEGDPPDSSDPSDTNDPLDRDDRLDRDDALDRGERFDGDDLLEDDLTTRPPQRGGPDASRRGRGRVWSAVTTDGFPVPVAALEQLLCYAVLDRITRSKTGRVLSLHSTARLATPAQVTAVIARDGGCVFPACAAPPSLCHVHHVRFWSHGGPTTVDNLALVCWRHHQLLHTPTKHPDDAWQLTMHHGLPHTLRPAWLDPHQTPLRNTLRHAIHHTRHAAGQMTRNAQPP